MSDMTDPFSTLFTDPLDPSATSAQERSTGDGTDERGNAPAVLARLFRDAEELGAAGRTLDAAWSASMSGVLLRSFERRDLDTLREAQDGLRRIAGSARRMLVQNSHPDAKDTTSASALEVARASLSTASAFVSMADASAAITRPGAVAYQPDWGSLPGRVLAALDQERPMFNQDVRERVQTSDTQLSREFKRLLEHGLVTRRHFGKQAAWTLTAAGAQAVADAPVTDTGAAVEDTTASIEKGSVAWASTLKEFKTALEGDPGKIVVGSIGYAEHLPAGLLTKVGFTFMDDLFATAGVGELMSKYWAAKLGEVGGGSVKVMPAKGWDIISPVIDGPLGHASTQREAITQAKSMLSGAGGGKVLIHDRTGKLRDKDSVDPSIRRGRRMPKSRASAGPGQRNIELTGSEPRSRH